MVVTIDVAQVPAGLDDVADASFEFLGLGEATVCLAVPEDGAGGRGGRGGSRWSSSGGVEDFHDKGAPRRGLEGDLA